MGPCRSVSSLVEVAINSTPRIRIASGLVVLIIAISTSCAGSNSLDNSAATTVARSEHGSHMAPPQVKVAQVARSGSGPAVGDRWKAWVALNVCGRFLEPARGDEVRGITPLEDGSVEISPVDEADAGANAVIGS